MGFIRRLSTFSLSLLLLSLCLPFAVSAEGRGQSRKIVIFDTSTVNEPAQEAIVRGAGGAVIKALPMVDGMAVLLPAPAVDALATKRGVIRVDDDLEVYATARKPQQPTQVVPWGIHAVNAPTAWSLSVGAGIKVAILDTGVQLDHPDLAANIAGGYNATNPRKSPSDGNGHGTHVAGTVAAINNSAGVIGVAPAARLYAVSVLNSAGSGRLSDLIDGLTWCKNNGIQVINMSLGSPSDNSTFRTAVTSIYNAGIVQVAAAGNNGSVDGAGAVDYPAAYPEVIAVSAVDSNYNFAAFSSSGPTVDLAAPGVGVLSTYIRSGYATGDGTSMAAPHVTGAAAIRLALYPGETPDEVKAALQSTATDIGLTPDQQGAGLVNAYGAALLTY